MIKDSELCDFCQDKSETLLHLFYPEFLDSSRKLAPRKRHLTIDKLDAIGLNCDAEHTLLSFCKLTARYYIYTSKNMEKYKSLVFS